MLNLTTQAGKIEIDLYLNNKMLDNSTAVLNTIVNKLDIITDKNMIFTEDYFQKTSDSIVYKYSGVNCKLIIRYVLCKLGFGYKPSQYITYYDTDKKIKYIYSLDHVNIHAKPILIAQIDNS